MKGDGEKKKENRIGEREMKKRFSEFENILPKM
jgi:hypothetical protein